MTKDDEIVLFHYVLGVAISQWSAVEHMIANILLCFYDSEKANRQALAVGFFSLEGFRSKLIFADGLVSRALAGTRHRADWEQLVIRARKLSAHRNKLAHWTIAKYWQCPSGQRVVLSPWLIKKPKKGTKVPRPSEGSLNITEIYKCSMAFSALAVSLENLLCRLCAQQEPHAKSDEQPGNPPTTETLIRQIREVLVTPPQPSSKKS